MNSEENEYLWQNLGSYDESSGFDGSGGFQ